MELKVFIMLVHVGLFGVLFRRRIQMAFYILILYLDLLIMFSLILIEEGAFISEQGVSGFDNSSYFIFCVYAFAKLILFYAFSKTIQMEVRAERSAGLFCIVSGIFFAMIVYALAKNPSASRFAIFAFDAELERFMIYMVWIYFATYVYCVFKDPRLTCRVIYLSIYVLLSYLIGDEFGGFLTAIVIYYIASLVHANRRESVSHSYEVKSGLLLPSFAVLLVFGAVAYKFSQLGDVLIVINRLVLSGHVFWGVVNLMNSTGPSVDLLLILQKFFTLEPYRPSVDYGFGQLMYAVSGQIAAQYLEDEGLVRFSGGYPSILIYHFGYVLGFLLNIALVAMFVYILKMQMYLLRMYNVIFFILFVKLSGPFVDLFQSGEYANINIKTLSMIALAVLFAMIWKSGFAASPRAITRSSG